MTHQDFWERYFYKVYQLQEDEKRKADLKNRADKLKQDDSEQAWEGNDYICFIQFSGLLLRYSTALLECSIANISARFLSFVLGLLLFNSSCCKAPWDEFFSCIISE